MTMTLLDKLFSLDLNLDGLMLDMSRHTSEYAYDCTPIGALPFASMGVDGVHYCIIPLEGDNTLEKSPVYKISPMDFSEGTVQWTARNFCDFISITAILKDAWVLSSLVYEPKDAFITELKDIKFEFSKKNSTEKKAIKKELGILTRNFPIVKIRNLYSYVNNAYLDINNHADVKFSESDIKEMALGHYAYGK